MESAQSGIGGMLSMFTGAHCAVCVFALGIMPYISVSIIVQLLTSMVPSRTIKEIGEQGRRKINQYTVMAPYCWRHFRPMDLPRVLKQAICKSILVSFSVFLA